MKVQAKVLLLMIASLVVIFCYALIPNDIALGTFLLKKLHLPMPFSNVISKPIEVNKHKQYVYRHQRILFFGDSMVEGLSRRFGDYCGESGHTLYSVIWYSSTTERWAKSNVIEHFIKKYRPTYLIICIGSNELFVNDLEERKKYIAQILKKVGKLPLVWISPNDWNGDTGIVDLIKKYSGKGLFYDSRPLKLYRGSDHYHPTWESAAYWMDEVAKFLNSKKCSAQLFLNVPKGHHKPTKTKTLSPSFENF